jgi:murein endopeptidase
MAGVACLSLSCGKKNQSKRRVTVPSKKEIDQHPKVFVPVKAPATTRQYSPSAPPTPRPVQIHGQGPNAVVSGKLTVKSVEFLLQKPPSNLVGLKAKVQTVDGKELQFELYGRVSEDSSVFMVPLEEPANAEVRGRALCMTDTDVPDKFDCSKAISLDLYVRIGSEHLTEQLHYPADLVLQQYRANNPHSVPDTGDGTTTDEDDGIETEPEPIGGRIKGYEDESDALFKDFKPIGTVPQEIETDSEDEPPVVDPGRSSPGKSGSTVTPQKPVKVVVPSSRPPKRPGSTRRLEDPGRSQPPKQEAKTTVPAMPTAPTPTPTPTTAPGKTKPTPTPSPTGQTPKPEGQASTLPAPTATAPSVPDLQKPAIRNDLSVLRPKPRPRPTPMDPTEQVSSTPTPAPTPTTTPTPTPAPAPAPTEPEPKPPEDTAPAPRPADIGSQKPDETTNTPANLMDLITKPNNYGMPANQADSTRSRLSNASKLDLNSPYYQPVISDEIFGTWLLVEMITQIGKAVYNLYGHYKILVGQLSLRNGGYNSPSVSHQFGIDADIQYIMNDPITPKFPSIISGGKIVDDFREDIQWKVWKDLADSDTVNFILVSPTIKKYFCSYANQINEDSIEKAKNPNHLLYPWKGHSDHWHMRIKCPKNSHRCTDLEYYEYKRSC